MFEINGWCSSDIMYDRMLFIAILIYVEGVTLHKTLMFREKRERSSGSLAERVQHSLLPVINVDV